MYESNQYNGAVFQQQPQGNYPPEQQFGGGGIYMQPNQQVVNPYQQQQAPMQQAVQNQVPVQPTQGQPTSQNTGINLITEQQAQQLLETLKPTPISNPVKIDRPAYLVTEEQMRHLLSLSNGNPLQFDNPPSEKNVIDTIGEVTLGTVNRLGHTFTGLVNSVVSVLTLGYGQEIKK